MLWETKWSVSWFDCDESLTCRGLDSNLGYFSCFTPICLCGELCLLVSWCVGHMCDMTGSDEDLGRNRRPGAEYRGWSSTGGVLDGQTIGRSGDAMCDLHHAQGDEEHEFLGWSSKPRSTDFPVWASKLTAMISWFGPQNWASDGLSIASQNWQGDDSAGHMSRSNGLLLLQASRARIFQFASKLAEERRRVLDMTSLRRPREDEVEDGQVHVMGCIKLFYLNFIAFVVQGPRGSLIF
jgi:hypothetical protein